jgi:hypothetical protein
MGAVSVTLSGAVGTRATYDIGLTLPYDWIEPAAVEEEGVTVDISGSATFEGQGQFVRPLPGLTWVGPDLGQWSSPEGWDGGEPDDVPDADVRTFVPAKIVALDADGGTASLLIDGADAGLLVEAGSTLTVSQNMEVAQGSLQIAATGAVDAGAGVVLAAGSQLVVELAGAEAGKIMTDDDTYLDGSLQFKIDGSDPFKHGDYPLVEVGAGAEEGIATRFGSVDSLGAYVSTGDDQDGLNYTNRTLTLTIDKDLNPGDANLDTKTNVLDFNEWNANKFRDGTDWASGDFTGDGKTNVLDFNVWNENKFTAAGDPAPLVEGQVPEPSTLLLLVCGGLAGLWASVRRRS